MDFKIPLEEDNKISEPISQLQQGTLLWSYFHKIPWRPEKVSLVLCSWDFYSIRELTGASLPLIIQVEGITPVLVTKSLHLFLHNYNGCDIMALGYSSAVIKGVNLFHFNPIGQSVLPLKINNPELTTKYPSNLHCLMSSYSTLEGKAGKNSVGCSQMDRVILTMYIWSQGNRQDDRTLDPGLRGNSQGLSVSL